MLIRAYRIRGHFGVTLTRLACGGQRDHHPELDPAAYGFVKGHGSPESLSTTVAWPADRDHEAIAISSKSTYCGTFALAIHAHLYPEQAGFWLKEGGSKATCKEIQVQQDRNARKGHPLNKLGRSR